MLEPVQLNGYPSCYNCMSWSSDGELAIASGESVFILTPKLADPLEDEEQTVSSIRSRRSPQWDFRKLQINVFTQAEWALMLPKAGATFSIGEEQSLSHATSLGWSAPGLAAYRRCMLGILTSNFLLSLWGTTDGADKWARLGIVNNTLRQYFKSSVEGDEYLLEQKGKIQSFAWSSPCNQCVEHPGVSENLGRWGIHILAVANQADDVVLLRVESQKTSSELTLEVLSHYSLTASEQVYPDTVPGSLFERTLQRQGPTIKHMAFKSWNTTPLSWDDESVNLTSAMALIYGTELRLLRFGAFMEFSESTGWSIKSIQIHGAGLEADTAVLISARFTGPITWIYEPGNVRTIAQGLVTGAIGGTVAVYFHDSIEEMPLETEFFTISACEREPWAEDPNTSPSDYWPAITGVSHTVCPLNLHNDRAWTGIICISDNVSATPLIRAANLSSLTDCYRCPTGIHGDDIVRDANNEPTSIQWRKGFETFVSEFNLENDLGGMAAARIWGLAAFLNWTATCFTLHPTDMAEHLIPSVERLRIVFCPSSDETEDHTEQGMPWHPPTYEPEHIGRARHPVLKYILDEQHRQYSNDPSLKRLVYGAICCVIVQETYSSALVQLAKSALSWLDQCTGTDLTEEISLLETVELDGEDMARSRSVPIRRTDDIDIHGREIRENCSICDHEIEWYSPLQSQCVFGHLFVRCSVTFMSITDPFLTCQCSRCGAEYYDERALLQEGHLSEDEEPKRLLRKILERFDTCIYCHGKFKA